MTENKTRTQWEQQQTNNQQQRNHRLISDIRFWT